MDIGVLRTTIMETGQWVDGDLYNGRIVLIANSYVLKMYLIIQGISLLWDEIKFLFNMVAIMKKAKNNFKSGC
jgi:hypothetical protein